MIELISGVPSIIKYPAAAAYALYNFQVKRLVLVALFCILTALLVSYGALVTFATSNVYQAKSLKAAIKISEDELARNQSRVIEYLKSANPSISEGLEAMQDAAVGISYVHAGTAIVEAPRPQP